MRSFRVLFAALVAVCLMGSALAAVNVAVTIPGNDIIIGGDSTGIQIRLTATSAVSFTLSSNLFEVVFTPSVINLVPNVPLTVTVKAGTTFTGPLMLRATNTAVATFNNQPSIIVARPTELNVPASRNVFFGQPLAFAVSAGYAIPAGYAVDVQPTLKYADGSSQQLPLISWGPGPATAFIVLSPAQIKDELQTVEYAISGTGAAFLTAMPASTQIFGYKDGKVVSTVAGPANGLFFPEDEATVTVSLSPALNPGEFMGIVASGSSNVRISPAAVGITGQASAMNDPQSAPAGTSDEASISVTVLKVSTDGLSKPEEISWALSGQLAGYYQTPVASLKTHANYPELRFLVLLTLIIFPLGFWFYKWMQKYDKPAGFSRV